MVLCGRNVEAIFAADAGSTASAALRSKLTEAALRQARDLELRCGWNLNVIPVIQTTVT
jgi:hypothetical protein